MNACPASQQLAEHLHDIDVADRTQDTRDSYRDQAINELLDDKSNDYVMDWLERDVFSVAVVRNCLGACTDDGRRNACDAAVAQFALDNAKAIEERITRLIEQDAASAVDTEQH